ncbi:glycine cleavage system protein H [Enterococcus sp. BWB1-3]|uniref:glycine cleavage system protein H n=1 Tax=Enterococcus sp. BWB1-3 TaxID=2787713 RepID=UPI0019233A30|nr:glycine cleavage system protein H [Enterococcus sp. BWB1-3]MBL1227948.1 glycine cleavage system protein H [Enterococcus sp. BWB1-3]
MSMERTVIDNLWIEKTPEGYKVGLTNQAQDDLGSISFVTLPKVGQRLTKGDAFVELEAEKSVSEFSSPLTGTIVHINEGADKDPAVLDDVEESNAWLAIFSDVNEDFR